MKPLPVELRMTANNCWTVVGLKDKTIKELYIPDKVDGYDIRSIADNAFADNLNLTYVNLPNTITYIGEDAFNGCFNLVRVYRNYSHYQKLVIKARAFFCCEQLSFVYLNGISEIGKKAFAGCTSLEEFPFDECKDVKIFHQEAFANTNIKKVILESQQICVNVFYHTPVEEVVINGLPTWSDDFLKTLKKAIVYLPKHSQLFDLGYLGIPVEEIKRRKKIRL